MIDGETENYIDKLKAAFPDNKDLVKIVSKGGSNKLIQKLFSKTLAHSKLNIDVLCEQYGSEFSKQFTGRPAEISKRLGI